MIFTDTCIKKKMLMECVSFLIVGLFDTDLSYSCFGKVPLQVS